ncbi:MAG TPA: MFS transporter [Candidatus Angelobacter sp.]|jgi:MFS family permease|nr:MFS transporter [Candidatus Angelobacter sp.]
MSSTTQLSYRALLAVPGFARLVGSALLSRTANQMNALLLVLFVLDRWHSPQLSGIVVLMAIIPGLLVSPIAGAILDRGARIPLIALDFVTGAAALTAVVVLAKIGVLQPWMLILIVAVASLTMPLSNSGTRSLFPLIVPRNLWDRANALDSGAFVVATVVGPGLAGVIVALAGATAALIVPAATWGAAALLLAGMHIPVPENASRGTVLADAWSGLLYVLRNRGLRALAVTLSVYNMGQGCITVALPVLVLTRMHGGSAQVGALFAVMGGAGIVAGLLSGRIDSEGRERELMIAGCLGSVVALLILALSSSMLMAAAGMAVFGLSNGPLDIGLFSLRQRVTHPAWFGRAFAVSMSLNFIGFPAGSAISGPVVAHSITLAFAIGGALVALSTLGPLLMLERRRDRADRRDDRDGAATAC